MNNHIELAIRTVGLSAGVVGLVLLVVFQLA